MLSSTSNRSSSRVSSGSCTSRKISSSKSRTLFISGRRRILFVWISRTCACLSPHLPPLPSLQSLPNFLLGVAIYREIRFSAVLVFMLDKTRYLRPGNSAKALWTQHAGRPITPSRAWLLAYIHRSKAMDFVQVNTQTTEDSERP